MNFCDLLTLWAIGRRLDTWDLPDGPSKIIGGIKDILTWTGTRFNFYFIFEKPLDVSNTDTDDGLISLHWTGLNGVSLCN